MTESEWTRRICQDLVEHNALVFACVAHKLQAPGWPDRWICHTLWQGWIEFKGKTTEVTALQRRRIREINARWPATAFVARWPGVLLTADDVEVGRFSCAVELLELANREVSSNRQRN